MIRTAVENHKGASEKEILEITRRVTQSRAQILLLDAQIEEINRKIDANPGPGETRDGLLRSKKEARSEADGGDGESPRGHGNRAPAPFRDAADGEPQCLGEVSRCWRSAWSCSTP